MATGVPKATAEAAAKHLRQLAEVELEQFKDVPMLILSSNNQETRAVVDSWFDNPANISQVEEKIENTSSKALRDRLKTVSPIVYGHLTRVGAIMPPFPGDLIVLLALEDLHENNGLPTWKGCPEKLSQGEDVCLSGDEKQTFRGKSGGLALLLVFSRK